VSAELIRADDETQIWGEQYRLDLSGLRDVEDEILFAVVENLTSAPLRQKKLTANSLTRHPESYRLYLKGRHLLEKHSAADIGSAVDHFNKSVLLDPSNIYSHVEIVECYRSLHAFGYISYEQFLEISSPVLEAIAKGNESIDVVQVLYCDLKMLEWKFEKAALYCKRALAINPNSLKGRLRNSDLLLQSRNFRSALEQLERLMIIDPLSPLIYKRIGRLFYMMGENESAIAFLNDALDLEPGCYEALTLRGAAQTEMSNFENALNDFDESFRAQPHPEILAMTLAVFAKQGNYAKAKKLLKKLEISAPSRSGNSATLAYAYLSLGEKDEALALLEQAYVQHEPDLRALTYDIRWVGIRSEPRFRALLKRIGLPDLEY
jgi:tetratricopeptide (TPR) repeat protein